MATRRTGSRCCRCSIPATSNWTSGNPNMIERTSIKLHERTNDMHDSSGWQVKPCWAKAESSLKCGWIFRLLLLLATDEHNIPVCQPLHLSDTLLYLRRRSWKVRTYVVACTSVKYDEAKNLCASEQESSSTCRQISSDLWQLFPLRFVVIERQPAGGGAHTVPGLCPTESFCIVRWGWWEGA